MDSRTLFQPGESVMCRSCPGGQVGYTIPYRVVMDSPEETVLFQPAGPICKSRTGRRGGPNGRNMLPDGWDGGYQDVRWQGPPTLRFYRWGDHYSVMRRWDFEQKRASGWYINLEAAWRPHPRGFDTEDWVLDVVLDAESWTWRWKDMDELEWAVKVGKRSQEEAAFIQQAGREAIARIEARAWPFHEDWSRFTPSPAWGIPRLPDDWMK